VIKIFICLFVVVCSASSVLVCKGDANSLLTTRWK